MVETPNKWWKNLFTRVAIRAEGYALHNCHMWPHIGSFHKLQHDQLPFCKSWVDDVLEAVVATTNFLVNSHFLS